MLRIPLFEHVEFQKHVTVSLILAFLSVVAVALALRFSWLCVGGNTNFLRYFVIDAYLAGVEIVLLTFVEVFQNAINQMFQLDETYFLFDSIYWFGLFAIGVWALMFWEVYRVLNNLGQGRALLSLVVFNIVMWPTFVFLRILEEYLITTHLGVP